MGIGSHVIRRFDHAQNRRHQKSRTRLIMRQLPQNINARAGNAHLFFGFTQGGGNGVFVMSLMPTTGQAHFTRVIRQMLGAGGQQHAKALFALNEWHQNRRRARRGALFMAWRNIGVEIGVTGQQAHIITQGERRSLAEFFGKAGKRVLFHSTLPSGKYVPQLMTPSSPSRSSAISTS